MMAYMATCTTIFPHKLTGLRCSSSTAPNHLYSTCGSLLQMLYCGLPLANRGRCTIMLQKEPRCGRCIDAEFSHGGASASCARRVPTQLPPSAYLPRSRCMPSRRMPTQPLASSPLSLWLPLPLYFFRLSLSLLPLLLSLSLPQCRSLRLLLCILGLVHFAKICQDRRCLSWRFRCRFCCLQLVGRPTLARFFCFSWACCCS